MSKLGDKAKLHVCYEAGPCGYGLYWQLTKMGIECDGRRADAHPAQSRRQGKDGSRDAENSRAPSERRPDGGLGSRREHKALRDLVERVMPPRDKLRHRNRHGNAATRSSSTGEDRGVGNQHMIWLEGQKMSHAPFVGSAPPVQRGEASEGADRATREGDRCRHRSARRKHSGADRGATVLARRGEDRRGRW